MMKPIMSKLGSNPEATTMPMTTGTSARYVAMDSRAPIIMNPSAAVKSGVVAPIAWLKETGIYRKDAFPKMMAMVNATDRIATCGSVNLITRRIRMVADVIPRAQAIEMSASWGCKVYLSKL